MAQLGENQSRHRQFHCLGRSGQREQGLAARYATDGAAEHRAAADLLPAQHSEQFAKAGERLRQARFDHADRLIATADAGPAVAHDAVDRGIGEILREELLKTYKLTPQQLAQSIKVEENIVKEIVKEQQDITPELSYRLGLY